MNPIGLTSPETITVRSYGAQTTGADRRKVRGSPSNAVVTAVVAPATPYEIEQLGEGARSREVIKVLTYSAVKSADQHTNTPADDIVRDGIAYMVARVSRWPGVGPIPENWESFAIRRTELPAVGGP